MARQLAFILCALLLGGCAITAGEEAVTAVVVADGNEQSFSLADVLSVEELLTRASIVLGENDRISHPLNLTVTDDMRITVRRVREEQSCQRERLPFERRLVAYEGIAPNEAQVVQAGLDGAIETCYVITFEDDVEAGRQTLGQPIILEEPLDEIVYVGTDQQVEPLPIPGRLSYINNGIAWTIAGNAVNKHPVGAASALDALVFAQNTAGTHLIYSSRTDDDSEFLNELWLIDFAGQSRPIKLPPTDVLYAEWRPGSSNVIAYSTAEAGQGSVSWKALNNLWLLQIDLVSGRAQSIEEIIPEQPGGAFGWWGTTYRWSPQGDRLAWANAEALGVVDLASKRLAELQNFAVFNSAQSWVWVSSLSWSHDGAFIASAVHGAPVGGESPETSPVFDLMLSRTDGSYDAVLRDAVGMWSGPAYSPQTGATAVDEDRARLAWLQARTPYNSNNSEYDLYVSDRDGSNQRRIFPPSGGAGILRSNSGLNSQAVTWSPDGRAIAVVYQGNIWLVDVETAASHQMTFDGGASRPVWTG